MVFIVILFLAWSFGFWKLMSNFKEVLNQSDLLVQLGVIFILAIGTPFFFIVEILELGLDLLLGEDWDS